LFACCFPGIGIGKKKRFFSSQGSDAFGQLPYDAFTDQDIIDISFMYPAAGTGDRMQITVHENLLSFSFHSAIFLQLPFAGTAADDDQDLSVFHNTIYHRNGQI
jgi:hypothetical protein